MRVTFILWLMMGAVVCASDPIRVKDADGVERLLNPMGQVTVIVYSNPAVQERTRQTGKALDLFQGRDDFRSIVIVDLRETMADWAPGYTVRRMVKDLDQEALRVTPAYREKGSQKNPRQDLSAVADFKGEVCVRLGWEKPKDVLRVIIFDQQGQKFRQWDDLKNFDELTKSVRTLFHP